MHLLFSGSFIRPRIILSIAFSSFLRYDIFLKFYPATSDPSIKYSQGVVDKQNIIIKKEQQCYNILRISKTCVPGKESIHQKWQTNKWYVLRQAMQPCMQATWMLNMVCLAEQMEVKAGCWDGYKRLNANVKAVKCCRQRLVQNWRHKEVLVEKGEEGILAVLTDGGVYIIYTSVLQLIL